MTPWRPVAFVLLGIAAMAADDLPEFTAAGVATGTRTARIVVPGRFVTIYGRNLGPVPGRCANAAPSPVYPTEVCGTQVFFGDRAAKLLYVSDKQINLLVPAELPEGTVDIRVLYDGHSSPTVTMKAGVEVTSVSLDSAAYAGMPVWLKVDLPADFGDSVRYPFILGPALFGCHQVELRRGGQTVPLDPGANWLRYQVSVGGFICGSFSPAKDQAPRLPLHLLYRLEPGTYEVRYTLRSTPPGFDSAPQPEVRAQSQWTSIEILPAQTGQRAEWLDSIRRRAPSDAAELLTDVLPSLLGVPDDASFDLVTGYLYHSDSSVRKYVGDGLYYWPDSYLVRKLTALRSARGPSTEIDRILANLHSR